MRSPRRHCVSLMRRANDVTALRASGGLPVALVLLIRLSVLLTPMVAAITLGAPAVAEEQSRRWVEIGATKAGVMLYDSQTTEFYGPTDSVPSFPHEARAWVRVQSKAGGYLDRHFIFNCDSREFTLTDVNTVDAKGKANFQGYVHTGGVWAPESDIETAGTKLCDLARKNLKQGDKPSP